MRFLSIGCLLLFTLTLESCAVFTSIPDPVALTTRIDDFPTDQLPLKGSARILWDQHQIPFIDATDDSDLPFLIGMVHAHLRLAQMEMMRRIAAGRISELAGVAAVDVDHTIRIMNFAMAEQQIIRDMDPQTRRWTEQFVAGINFYQSRLHRRPHEFDVLGIESESWTINDIVRIGRLAAVDVNWIRWFTMLQLMESNGGRKILQQMDHIGRESIPSFTAGTQPRGDALSLSSILLGNSRSGSNSFVLAPSRTTMHSAMIVSDPHLGIMIPPTWLICGYRSPGNHAVGFMIPGLPFIALGRNRDVAWGGTNMRSLSSDLVDITDQPDAAIRSHRETIKVRYWPDREVTIRISDQGPILSDSPMLKAPAGKTYAMKWVGHRSSDELSAFLKASRTHNWNEFKAAFASYAVSGQNILYADRSGNIGQLLAVKIPQRSGDGSRLVISAAIADREWKKLSGPLDLPVIENPQSGYLASSNNIPVKTTIPIGLHYSSNDRIERITYLIEQRTPISLEKAETIQRDLFSYSSYRLARRIIEILELPGKGAQLDSEQLELVRAIKQWDGSYGIDSPGALAFQLVLYHFIASYYPAVYGEDVADALYNSEYAASLVLEELGTDTKNRNWLIEAVAASRADFSRYRVWGNFHRLKVSHGLGMIPIWGSGYVFGDVPAPGSSTTIQKTAHAISGTKNYTMYGANSRHISIMNDPDANYFLLLGGQDGNIESPNIVDQVPMWMKGELIQVPLTIDAVERSFPYQRTLSRTANSSENGK